MSKPKAKLAKRVSAKQPKSLFERLRARAGKRTKNIVSAFVENDPKPAWMRSPWAPACELLAAGSVEQVALLLEHGEPIPLEWGTVLARALRGGKGLPFRLALTAKPQPGKKRSGRWPELHTVRNMTLAAEVATLMAGGAGYDAATRNVAHARGMGDRTVKYAYDKWKHLAPDWAAFLVGVGRASDA